MQSRYCHGVFILFMCSIIPAEALNHPFLQWIPEPYIVIPEKASRAEIDAAQMIARSGGWESGSVIVTDSWLLNHISEGAYRDLIVLGTDTGNAVFAAYPSTWALSSALEPGSIIPDGLFVFGVGDIMDPHAGFIEPGRNPLTVLMADRAQHEGTASPPPRWIIRLCGLSARGVKRVTDAFLNQYMISGVVFNGDDPRGREPFVLSTEELSTCTMNWNHLDIDPEYTFIGWHQADALLFSGLEASTGSRPKGVWRFAYRNRSESRRSSHSPHRTNSDSEILVIQMGSREDAARGAKTILDEFGTVTTKQHGDGLLLEIAGMKDANTAMIYQSYILLENFGDGYGSKRLSAFVGGKG